MTYVERFLRNSKFLSELKFLQLLYSITYRITVGLTIFSDDEVGAEHKLSLKLQAQRKHGGPADIRRSGNVPSFYVLGLDLGSVLRGS